MTDHDDDGAPRHRQDAVDFTVLIVCTGNLCRSPVAEFLLRDAVERKGHSWTIHSAGLAAQDGDAMHPHALSSLAQRQIDTTGWTTHALTRAAIEKADIVLTATRSQAEAVVGIVPSALMRVFPLQQFARLASAAEPGFDDPVDTGPALLIAANRARTRVATINPAQDDIADPVRRSRGFFRRRVHEIDVATGLITGRLITSGDKFEAAATS